MSKIFIGFLFVFLNLSFKLDDTHVINLLPDFIGFMLLYLGTRELREESRRYTTAAPWLLVLTAYGIASWLMKLLGIDGGWVASQTAGDRITVENQGNVSVQVRLSYQSSYAAVSAEFIENGAAVAAPVSLGEGERQQMSVKLSGKPAGAMTGALLGTITIRIEEDSAL